jgi:hypothetical protein
MEKVTDFMISVDVKTTDRTIHKEFTDAESLKVFLNGAIDRNDIEKQLNNDRRPRRVEKL